ncbi:MAG: DUF2232 domain-containing protein [Peptococcaceae bacterium]|nr:DUF2232 domain-containing protein [Peptococcaceae bacterium]
MYISDKDVLNYACKFFLVFLPLIWSLYNVWSWLAEIFLLLVVFYHARSSGIKLTAILLAAGYLIALIAGGRDIIWQIGFVPWVGILVFILQQRGMKTSETMFWCLMLAALLSALPIIPAVRQALQPGNLQRELLAIMQLYDQQGVIKLLTGQGIVKEEIEKYVNIMLMLKYRLMPGFVAIIGMLGFSLTYLGYRFFTKQKVKNFSLWSLPWYAVWAVIIGIIAYLGGDYYGHTAVAYAGLNLMLIMAVICVVLGFSCLIHFYRRILSRRALIILVGIFLFIFVFSILTGNPLLMGFLYLMIFMWMMAAMFIGLFDLLFNFRKLPGTNKEVK